MFETCRHLILCRAANFFTQNSKSNKKHYLEDSEAKKKIATQQNVFKMSQYSMSILLLECRAAKFF